MIKFKLLVIIFNLFFVVVDNFVLKLIFMDVVVFIRIGYLKFTVCDVNGLENEVFIIIVVELWG